MPSPPEFDADVMWDRVEGRRCKKCEILIAELERSHEHIERLKRHVEMLQRKQLSPTVRMAAEWAARNEFLEVAESTEVKS